jgi:beta-glucosidase
MADVEALLAALTLEEKAALTAGEGMFNTPGVERLGIPGIQVTDGPSGARGLSYPGLGGPASTCIPCGSAIGATWDPSVAEQLGALVARDAVGRGCRGLLAPTVNLHRSPLAGRNFECYSEDPFLSGKLAAGYVRGVQSEGVFATVKHFVCNDAEFERFTISSEVDERTMRELYLVPFEIAVKEGGALAIMSSYNRVNGRWVTQQPELLIQILREEWGFEGLVMTDWYATVDTDASLQAGLDLEMPGPGRGLGASVVAAVKEGRVDEDDLDAALRRLLGGYNRIGALDGPPPPMNPQPPGDEDRALLRRAGAEAIVLLRNDGVLPLNAASLRTVAVLGPRAADPCLNGGGSARVIPHKVVAPLAELRTAFGDDVQVVHERGCEADRSPRTVGGPVLHAPDGFDATVYTEPGLTGEMFGTKHLEQLRVFVFTSGAQEYPDSPWSMRVTGTIVPEEDGVFELALAQAGRTRVHVDGELVLDGAENPPPPGGSDFFGMASKDLVSAGRTLTKGTPVQVVVEFDSSESSRGGFRVGFRTVDGDTLMERAVAAAADADAAVVVVGTSEEWESEGHDRDFMELPARQAELIEKVAATNPRTVVVVNAAAPVDMAWAGKVAAVLQCSFGGEEMAGAVADVVMGRAEPGGRLPTTIPAQLAHNPSYDNFPGEGGELRYGEGVFMGYRGYEHRGTVPRFPFGHGLSYTTFDFGEPALSATEVRSGDTLTVSVAVTNTGTRAGSEVVQCYVAPVSPPRLARPPKELKAFAKVRLEPGETTVAELALDERSFSYWDPGDPDWERIVPPSATQFFGRGRTDASRRSGWQADPGDYDVVIGRSSIDVTATARVRWAGSGDGVDGVDGVEASGPA